MSQFPFSDLIRSKRHELGLTQGQIADRTEGSIPQATLSAWERGRQLPDANEGEARLQKLARVLALAPDELLLALAKQARTNNDSRGLSDDAIAFDYFRLAGNVETLTPQVPTPEPMTLVMLGTGLTALAMRRRRKA